MLSQFQKVGNALFNQGLVSSHSGNLSIRVGEKLIITRRGSMLGHLREQDLVETGIDRNDRATPLASTELAVHRAIYKKTSALAIVHAHPPHALALSLVQKEIVPIDMEGSLLLSQIPILGWKMKLKPGDLADEIAQTLEEHRIVLVYGHGSFAVGQLLEEAYHWTSALEQSCHVIYLLRALNLGVT